jgi:hypothetical protein
MGWYVFNGLFSKNANYVNLTAEEKRIYERINRISNEPTNLNPTMKPIIEKKESLEPSVKKGFTDDADFDTYLRNIERASYNKFSSGISTTYDNSSGLEEKKDWCEILKNEIQKTFKGVTPKDTIFADVYKVVSRDLKETSKYTFLHRCTFSDFVQYWNSSEIVEFKLPEQVESIRVKYSEIDYANLETALTIEDSEYSNLKEYYNNNKGNIPIEELLKKELRNNKKVNNSIFIKMLIWLDEYLEFKNIKKEINYGF